MSTADRMDPSHEEMNETKPETGAASEPAWRRRLRNVLFVGLLVQLVGVATFLAGLYVGEATEPTFFLLYAPRQPVLAAAVLAALLAPLTRRRWLLPVQLVGCLVALFPIMGLKVGLSRRVENRIRLVSYNVYFGKMSRPRLAEEIVAMNADIIVIEAGYRALRGQLKATYPDRAMEELDEFLIVSRFPIQRCVEPKPIQGEEDTAKYIGCLLDGPSGAFWVYGVHPFSPRHALFGGGEAKDANVVFRERQIAGALESARSNGSPFILVGDTNLPDPSPIARKYFAGLRDAFADVGFGFGYTFPAKHPWMRIDRAFSGDGVRFSNVRVGALGESDHRPLIVEFEIVR